MLDDSDAHNTASQDKSLPPGEALPQQDMFSGEVPSSVAEDIVGRRSVQLRSYKSLERLRDRVLLTSRELARVRAENRELKRQVEELRAGGGTAVDGTPIVFTESPGALRSKVEGFIEALDQYLQEDVAGTMGRSESQDA